MIRGKPDASSKAIDDYMRTMGASVLKLDSLGHGAPDRLYGIRGRNLLAELKTGKKDLRPNQIEWVVAWRGADVYVLHTEGEARAMLRKEGIRA